MLDKKPKKKKGMNTCVVQIKNVIKSDFIFLARFNKGISIGRAQHLHFSFFVEIRFIPASGTDILLDG